MLIEKTRLILVEWRVIQTHPARFSIQTTRIEKRSKNSQLHGLLRRLGYGPKLSVASRAVQLRHRPQVHDHGDGLGGARHVRRRLHRQRTGLAVPQLRYSPTDLRAAAPGSHHPGDLRLRRQRPVRHLLLRGAAHLPGPAGLPLAGRIHLLGLDRRRGAGRAVLHGGF